MKKLLYILAASFMMISCSSENCSENTKVKNDIPFVKVEECGINVRKTKIENHTYILLFGHRRMALEHDPECPYCKEQELTKHKSETTENTK